MYIKYNIMDPQNNTSDSNQQIIPVIPGVISSVATNILNLGDQIDEELLTFYYYYNDSELIISSEICSEYGEPEYIIELPVDTAHGAASLDDTLTNIYNRLASQLNPGIVDRGQKQYKKFTIKDLREINGAKSIKAVVLYDGNPPKIKNGQGASWLIAESYKGSQALYFGAAQAYQDTIEENTLVETVRDDVKDLRRQIERMTDSINKIKIEVRKGKE